jgi:hypothetical protein
MPGDTEVPVTVTSNGEPMEGYMCVIMKEGEMSGCCATDASGQAVISVPGGFEGLETAELVISGYDCLPTHYTIDIAVGLDENFKDRKSIFVQPNPASDHTALAFTLDREEQVKVSFYLLSGQLLDEISFHGTPGRNQLTVRTDNWPEGLIQARISTGSGEFSSRIMHITR